MTTSIWVLHGPNLNLLGTREVSVYGATTLPQINQALVAWGKTHGADVQTWQSNHEGELLDLIHRAQNQGVEFIVINPAAYTHTSVALRDALAGVAIPFIEVHLSNVYSRESFRHHSYLAGIAVGTIAGMGPRGYRLALEQALESISKTEWPPSDSA